MKKRLILSSLLTFSAHAALADDLIRYRDESRAVALPFLQELNAANRKAIAQGGPESAVKVCQEVAPKMAGDISRKNGWKVSRVSLKARNPLLGTPDQWEQTVLKQYEERMAKGEQPDTLETAEIVNQPTGKSFRYLKAIVAQPGCMACHGSAEQIGAGVKARLGETYPHDPATGYAPGQLRGAVSIWRHVD
jgi:hypothetical protein